MEEVPWKFEPAMVLAFYLRARVTDHILTYGLNLILTLCSIGQPTDSFQEMEAKVAWNRRSQRETRPAHASALQVGATGLQYCGPRQMSTDLLSADKWCLDWNLIFFPLRFARHVGGL